MLATPMLASESNSTKQFGILAVDFYVPKQFVSQTKLEEFDGVSAGKYTIGLGQERMAICDDREDIHSICLSVVSSLMTKYNISYSDIGRLEVGTETIIDKSKSVKSVLMHLFAQSGNTDVEGIDTTNACYGGTNALFNALNWLESSYWDGRYALVVAADIAVYKSGSARPTGGAGAVAMLLGPNAPIVFDSGLRSTHMEHVYDFYKPDLHSEYPLVDGPLSNACYIKAVDTCYQRYVDKIEKMYQNAIKKDLVDARNVPDQMISENVGDYFVFHCPYTKLVQKSFARLSFNDFKRYPDHAKFQEFKEKWSAFLDTPVETTYTNKDIEKAFMQFTQDAYQKKVLPCLNVAKNVGNMYCASLYGGLVSLLGGVDTSQLQNKRIIMFSYGSGLASSMFSAKVVGDTSLIYGHLDLSARLASRTEIDPQAFNDIMALREEAHNRKDYVPVSNNAKGVWPGAFILKKVDDKFRREYVIVE